MAIKLKRILISILCVLSCVCGAVALNFNATNSTFNVSAEVIESTIPDVQDFYMLGDKMTFPTIVENVVVDQDDANSAIITAVDGVIYYPNDIPYSIVAGREYSLNIEGTYTLKYFGEDQGKDYIVIKKFAVIDSLYGLSSNNGSFIEYATEEYLKTQTNYTPNSNAAHNIINTKLTHSGDEALTVHLEDGTSFIYSKPINLRELGADGLADIISFEPRAEDWKYGIVPYLDTNFNQVYDSQGRALYAQDMVGANGKPDGMQDNTTNLETYPHAMTEHTVKVGRLLYAPMLDEDGDGAYDIPLQTGYYPVKAVARELVITLTDCYDPTRYINIMVSSPQSTSTATLSYTPYAKANTDSFAQYYGLWSVTASENHLVNYPTTGTTNISGKPNIVLNYPAGKRIAWTTQNDTVWHYGGDFGGYRYAISNPNNRYKFMNFKFDLNSSTIYASSTNVEDVETAPTPFTDFSNQILYPNGGFRGFTTGEVYISVSFDRYVTNEPARVDIFSIGGTKVSDLFDQEGFDPALGESQFKYQDDVAPDINVDFAPTLNGGAYVAVGDKFTIPSAQAFDINLVGDVSVSAYLNYDSSYQLAVPIVDGKISVNKADTYYIVYTAKDQVGNKATKVIKVFGTNSESTILMSYDESQFEGIKAGAVNTFVIPTQFQSLNLLETYDELVRNKFKLRIEIVSDYEKIVIANLNGFDEIEAFLESETPIKYKLSYVGTYKALYYFADNAVDNFDNPISCEVEVAESDELAIYDKPFMYRHYIKDAYYDFDTIAAYGFTTGQPAYAQDAELWLKFDGGDYVKQNSVYSVKITGSQTIQAKYVSGNAFVETDVYPIVDVGYASQTADNEIVDFSNYFVSEDLTVDTEGSNLFYSTTKTDGSNSLLQYIKTLDISTFTLAYKIDQDEDVDYSNFTGIRFILTDVYNPQNKLSIYNYKEGDKFYIQCNDLSPKQLSDSFFGKEQSISFILDGQILTASGLSTYFMTDIDFTSSEVYLDIELCGITGKAGVTLNSLNAANLKRSYKDRDMPGFANVITSGIYKIGDVVTISAAKFIDDSSIITKADIGMSVSLNGEYLTSVDNIKLDGTQDPTRSYQIKILETGRYSVTYTAKDNFNHRTAATFYFSAKDSIAPTLTFSSEIKEDVIVYAKPGYTVKLAFTIKDNVTPDSDLTFNIFVLNMQTSILTVVPEGEKSFQLKNEGTYEISVIAYDADGNSTTKSFTVVISKEAN